jgi:hypothetical protein
MIAIASEVNSEYATNTFSAHHTFFRAKFSRDFTSEGMREKACAYADAIIRFLHFNEPEKRDVEAVEAFKVLVIDDFTIKVVATLLHTEALRQHGVTLVLAIDKEREAIADAPVVYFVQSTPGIASAIVRDLETGLYKEVRFMHDFTIKVVAPLLHTEALRQHGVTLVLAIDKECEAIADAPVMYFVQSTAEIASAIMKQLETGLYVQPNLFDPKLVNPKFRKSKVAVCVHSYCSSLVSNSLIRKCVNPKLQEVVPKCFGLTRLDRRGFMLACTTILINTNYVQDYIMLQECAAFLCSNL